MADRRTEKAARYALADLVAGKYQDVAAFLAKLGDVPAPALKRPRARRVAPPAPVVSAQLREDYNAVQYAALREQRGKEPVTPLAKPAKRHVDRDLLAEFRAQFPTCCIRGCELDAHPHHLIRRSEHGSDAHENLIPLCDLHHTGRVGWHTLTPDVWVPRFSARLPNLIRLKIRLALETLAERKAPVLDVEEA